MSVPVTRLLHCNHNCRDIELLTRFYTERLGLNVVMRSVTDPGGIDGRPMGVDGFVETETRFLYDERGPRIAPALELVCWFKPPTAGDVYAQPNHVGIQALGFVGGDLVEGPRQTIRDPEGLPIELCAGDGPTRASHVRVSCRDLGRSLAWYRDLGCVPTREPCDERWPVGSLGLDRDGEVSTASLGFAADDSYTIELTEWHEPRSSGPPYPTANHRGLYRMALAVDDVRAAHADALDRGCDAQEPVYFHLPGTPIDGLWIAFLRDPDGIVVELVERPASAVGT